MTSIDQMAKFIYLGCHPKYFEMTDFCLRMEEASIEIAVLAQVYQIIHQKG